jgi:CheY-like chemotaxis protein
MDATGIARGKLRLVREPRDVERLVQECIDSSRPQAELRGIHLSFVPAAERPFVAGDGLRLRQVFLNLLTNALKFTPPGGQVWVRTRSGEGGLLAVEVQDDGVGFEPAHAPQLFAAFERLACGPSDPGGLGLGLSISKGLVELHDGRISASSLGPHRGACFVVELPEVERPLQSATIIPPPLELPPVVSASGTVPRRRLLVVEDHADTAEMLRTLLEERGYAVVTAESLKRALAIDVSCIDAIICDLGLPDGSGTELLRALPRDADRPAIALSGYGMAADVENARQAGFDLHLTKPVDFERLLQALESLLGRSSARGSSLATG